MKRVFIVSGWRPVNKQVNDFIEACDLGINGVFVQWADRVTITLADDCTPEKMERQPEAIVHAYEVAGWKKVCIREVTIATATKGV